MPKHVVIIGAGPAGLAAADHALQLGHRVTVVEKSDISGGKGSSRLWGDFVIDYGPHVYHAMTKEITDFMCKYGGQEFVPVKTVQKLYVTEQPMRYPLQFKEAFSKFGLKLKIKIVFDFFCVRIKSFFIRPSLDSFKSWGVANYGTTLYNICFGYYSQRVWGIDADHLSVEFIKRKLSSLSLGGIFWQLITGRSPKKLEDRSYLHVQQYFYHRHGIGRVYANIAQSIQQRGGEIIYNAQIQSIQLIGKKVKSLLLKLPCEKTIDCDILLSTAPLDDLAEYLCPQDDPLRTWAQAMPFKHGVIVNAVIKRRQFSEAHWIYLVNQRFYFNRLSEPKNFSPYLAPDTKTLIMLETICGLDDQRWTWEPRQWKQHVVDDLSFFGVKEEELENIFLTKMEKAFPFYLVGYEKIKKEYLDRIAQIPNLITTGRYGLYIDINMHDAMVLGKSAVDYVLEERVGEFYREHERICLLKREG